MLIKWEGRRKGYMEMQAYYVKDNKTGSIIYLGKEHLPDMEFVRHDEAIEFLQSIE